MLGAVRAVFSLQVALSDALDRRLPSHFRIDGQRDYQSEFAPKYIASSGIEVWDVGGGKCPLIAAHTKSRLGLHYVGLDLSPVELSHAPAGIYDETFSADISGFVGRASADLIICQAVLEHVADTFAALQSFWSILRPGGIAVVFVPARNTVPAYLNLIIPERAKRKLLSAFWPELDGRQGYPAFYNRCTAPEFRKMAHRLGFQILEERLYHCNGYFRYMFPMHALWRLWCCTAFALSPARWAESFSMALRKPL